MRRYLLILLLIIPLLNANADTVLSPGKIKPVDGPELDVMIQYNAWKLTPSTIRYQLQGSEELIKASPEEVEYIIIDNIVTFISAEVKIDVSSDIDVQISPVREPKWETQRIFLREESSVGTKLYSHKTNQYLRYFYLKPEDEIPTQLVYKRYREQQLTTSVNRDFRKQLKDEFSCEAQEVDYRKIRYRRKELVAFFKGFNLCQGYDIEMEVNERPKAKFTLGLRGGLVRQSGEVERLFNDLILGTSLNITSEYEATNSVSIGVVGELALPYRDHAWALLIEAQYEKFRTRGDLQNLAVFTPTARVFGDQPWNQGISHVIFGIGLKRYFDLKEGHRFFLNAGVNSNFTIDLKSDFYAGLVNDVPLTGGFNLEVLERSSFFFGAGYAWSKWSVEARYNSPREVLSNVNNFTSKYQSISLMVGVRLVD